MNILRKATKIFKIWRSFLKMMMTLQPDLAPEAFGELMLMFEFYQLM